MAKANWLNVQPSTGSGDGTVQVSSKAEHTGRKVRTTTLTWKAANVEDVVRTVNQAGKPEFTTMATSASADKLGKVVTISGQSNSAKLTFSLGTGNLEISLPASYTANSITTTNGAAIAGDPGAAAVYPFSIAITVPSNDTIAAMSRQIIVTDEAGNRATCTLSLAAGDPFVIIAEGDIELDYKGTAVTVAVDSNCDWEVI